MCFPVPEARMKKPFVCVLLRKVQHASPPIAFLDENVVCEKRIKIRIWDFHCWGEKSGGI
jgi:hypothetical protein